MRINLFNRQPPFLDYHPDGFRIWTIYNSSVTSGSYYHLQPNGVVDLITVLDGNPIDIIRMQHEGGRV